MDNRLIGKWYKEDMGETINIFDETPPRMKMSFTSSGYYNFEPNCVYEKDGYFCYEINDEYYRMVYHVKFADGCLEGYYTQHGKGTPVKYTKISDTPEDAPQRYEPTEIFVPNTEETRFDILTKYAEYDRSREYGSSMDFVLGGDTPAVLEKYGYSNYIEGLDSSSDELVFKLLDFVCDHFGHNGTKGLGSGRTITDLIEFCESNDGKSNCKGLAILLASVLRLNGIKAQHITCMPYEEPFDDCHVVVDCLLPSGKRRATVPVYTVEQYLTVINNVKEFISAELVSIVREMDKTVATILSSHTPKHLQDQVAGIAAMDKFVNAVCIPATILIERQFLSTVWHPLEMPTTYVVLK